MAIWTIPDDDKSLANIYGEITIPKKSDVDHGLDTPNNWTIPTIRKKSTTNKVGRNIKLFYPVNDSKPYHKCWVMVGSQLISDIVD